MNKHSGYQPVDTAAPFRGLASTIPGTRVPSGFASDLMNVVVRDGVVRRRPGYLQLGQQLDGVVLDIVEFAAVGATERMIVFTSLAQYWYDPTLSSGNLFIDISVETVVEYDIDSIDTTAGEVFQVSEDLTTELQGEDGMKFVVTGSVSNDGTYTIATSGLTGGGTEATSDIEVDETIPDHTDDTGVISLVDRSDIGDVSTGLSRFILTAKDTTSYMSAGDTIYVKGSTGNDGTYTISAVTEVGGDTRIIVNESVDDTAVDGYITHRADRAYTEGDILNSEAVTDINSRRLLHTNGVDNVIQWFGVTGDPDGHFMRWAPLFASFDTCKTLKIFKEHLFLGDISTTTDEPSLIGWSDSGDFEDFTNGNSGSQLLYELPTGIKQLRTLGDRIIIYSDDALASGIFVGTPFIFAFETVIPAGTRLASARSIVSINVGHIYASEENFYLFDGSRGLRTLADIIRTDYKDQKKHDTIYQIFALNDYSKKTIYVAVPTLDDNGLIYTMEYDAFNLAQRAWAKERYADHPRAFGFFTNSISYTWADTDAEAALATTLGLSNLPWSQEVGPWSNEGEQADFPVRVFGDANGYVFASTEGTESDNGTTPAGYFVTGDLTVPKDFLSTLGRWGEIEFEAKGASGATVTVKGMTEFGTVASTEDVVALSGSWNRYKVPIDVTSETLRIRFDFPGAFQLRWARAWVKAGSPLD